MSLTKYTPIRFLRSTLVSDSRSDAILKLNLLQNKIGQPVVVKYFSTPEKVKIDMIFAIGISDGVGVETYRIISTGGVLVVTDVVTELPDVTQLVNGETYVYTDSSDGKNYLIFLSGVDRVSSQILEDQTVISLVTGKSYYISEEIVKEVSDFYTQSQIDSLFSQVGDNITELGELLDTKILEVQGEILSVKQGLEQNIQDLNDSLSAEIQELMIEVFPLTISFNTPIKIFEIGTSNDINFTFSVIRKGLDVTPDCTFNINGVPVTTNTNTFLDVTQTTSFNLTAQYKDLMSDSSSLTVNYVNRSFWATVEDTFIPTSENIKLKDTGTLRTKSTLTYVTNLNSQRIFYAYPKSYGLLSHIYDSNGFDYLPDYERSEIIIDGVQYYVYLKGIKATINNFRQQFTY